MENIIGPTSYSPDVEKHAVMRVMNKLQEEIHHLQSIAQNGYGRPSSYSRLIDELQQELGTYEELLGRFHTSSRRQLFSSPAFRRAIYLRNLTPRSIVQPRFDVVFNTEYIRRHEASVKEHLREYVSREVSAITRDDCGDIDEIMDNIINYLAGRTNRITIVTYLKGRSVCHPHQFLNNLLHFASTGQTLAVYDQNSEFVPRSANHILPYKIDSSDDVLILNSNEGNEIQVVGESQTAQRRDTPTQINGQVLRSPDELAEERIARDARIRLSRQGGRARNHHQTIEIDDEDDSPVEEALRNTGHDYYLIDDSDIEALQ